MISWKTLIVGFLVGLVAGGGWGAWYMNERFRSWERSGGHEEKLLREFTHILDLTDDQQKAVAAILQEQREKIKSVRGELRPRMEEIRQRAGDEIRALLLPEQQRRFDAFEEKKKEERKRREEER